MSAPPTDPIDPEFHFRSEDAPPPYSVLPPIVPVNVQTVVFNPSQQPPIVPATVQTDHTPTDSPTIVSPPARRSNWFEGVFANIIRRIFSVDHTRNRNEEV